MKGLPSTSRWLDAVTRSPAKRIAVYVEDRASFLEALCALWSVKKLAVLPGDVLPGTLEALGAHVDGYLGDFPSQIISLQPGEPRELEGRAPFDREHEGVGVFTSGSTGAPTLIPKKLRQLFDEIETLEKTFGARLTQDTVFVSTVSHQHIYGLLFAVLWPLVTGRKLSERRLEYPEELEVALARGPSVLVSSPAHLKRIPEGKRWVTQTCAVFSSGGPLPVEGSQRALDVIGHRPLEVFGSSETGGIAWRDAPEKLWLPLDGVTVRLDDGVLVVSSPHLPDAGAFLTSDRAEFEGPGFRLLGRADRIAKIEEKRVSLELIESTAVRTGLVSVSRVVALEGARVTLGLVGVPTAEGDALHRKELVERLRSALAEVVERVAIPRRFRFVKSLPVDDQGKVTNPRLAMLFAPDRPTVTWKERTPEVAVLEFTVVKELKVLDGHFPEAPIVPGVAQLDWAIGFGREHFAGVPRSLVRVEVLKFQKLMMPGHVVTLTLEWKADKSTLHFKYTGQGEAVYSSGRVVLKA